MPERGESSIHPIRIHPSRVEKARHTRINKFIRNLPLSVALTAALGYSAERATGGAVSRALKDLTRPAAEAIKDIVEGKAPGSRFKEPVSDKAFSVRLASYTSPEGIIFNPILRDNPDVNHGQRLSFEGLEKIGITSENLHVRLIYGGTYQEPQNEEAVREIQKTFRLRNDQKNFWQIHKGQNKYALWAEILREVNGKLKPIGVYVAPTFLEQSFPLPASSGGTQLKLLV